ncbi:BA75_03231T0 [Komagataella pastoris]|uniref:BA75_03231T0 n=1 Tax=Komagataella pastoris TaxID=4922 RepID=A0A1B2JE31_PICPA|nr:BA75_03231T0 [Komagataella pastoris]
MFSGLRSKKTEVDPEGVIETICDRLSNATLLTDRRAAVLSLKNFSRDYRESVIGNGLKGLVSTLHKDILDIDVVKAVLETLLILFIRGESDEDQTRSLISEQSRAQNGKYPSPSLLAGEVRMDQFSLLVADELTQATENFDLLLKILDSEIGHDFYIKIYTIQILEALVSCRPSRSKECIVSSPLGTPLLVSLLDDPNEPIRNEIILLLMGLVNQNNNIQKLVVFQNCFDKLFEIIHLEGGIRGSIVVQDCLTLICNLLEYNASNQKTFLETNCIPKLQSVLSLPLVEEIVWNPQRLSNHVTTLEIIRIFLQGGGDELREFQSKLAAADILLIGLKLVFIKDIPHKIRGVALLTISDLIRGNSEIQYEFSQIDVPYIDPSLPSQLQKFDQVIPVTIALLNWCLHSNSVHIFDIRVAAYQCLEAYFQDNEEAIIAFTEDQIESFKHQRFYYSDTASMSEDDSRDNDETIIENGNANANTLIRKKDSPKATPTPQGNIFQTLLTYDSAVNLNPYKIWFASYILMALINGSEQTLSTLLDFTVGDASEGDEIIFAIQTMLELLVTNLAHADSRIIVAYLMLLIYIFYENFEAVDGFLEETSNTTNLLDYLSRPSNEDLLVQGLIHMLLGIIYEFSRKESPICRKDLLTLLSKHVSVNAYCLKITELNLQIFSKYSPDTIFDPPIGDNGLPEVYLNPFFVDLVKENLPRIRNALSHDPNSDPILRLDYESYETLENDFQELSSAFEVYKNEYEDISEKYKVLTESNSLLEEEYESLKSKFSNVDTKFAEVWTNNESLEKEHSKLLVSFNECKKTLQELEQTSKQLAEAKTKLEEEKSEDYEQIKKMAKNLFTIGKENEEYRKMKKEQNKLDKKHETELDTLHKDIEVRDSVIKEFQGQLSGLRSQVKEKESAYANLMQRLRDSASLIKRLQSENRNLKDGMAALREEVSSSRNSSSDYRKESDETIRNLQGKLQGMEQGMQIHSSLCMQSQDQKVTDEDESLATKIAIQSLSPKIEGSELKKEMEKSSESPDQIQEHENDPTLSAPSTVSPDQQIGKEISNGKEPDSQAVVRELEEKLAQTTKHLLELKLKVDGAGAGADDAPIKIEQLTTALETTKDQLITVTMEYNEKLDEMKGENNALQSSIFTLNGRREEMEKELKESKEHIIELEELINAQKVSNKELESKLQESTDSLKRQSEILVELDREKQLLEERVDSLESQLAEISSDHETLVPEDEEHGKLLQLKDKEIEELKSKVDGLEDEKAKLSTELNLIQEDIYEVKRSLQDQIRELAEEKFNLQNSLSLIESEKKQPETDLLEQIKLLKDQLDEKDRLILELERGRNEKEMEKKPEPENEDSARLQSIVNDLKTELRENQSQLDDLMLVMLDLEAKKAHYKKLAMEHGHTISEDESEENKS